MWPHFIPWFRVMLFLRRTRAFSARRNILYSSYGGCLWCVWYNVHSYSSCSSTLAPAAALCLVYILPTKILCWNTNCCGFTTVQCLLFPRSSGGYLWNVKRFFPFKITSLSLCSGRSIYGILSFLLSLCNIFCNTSDQKWPQWYMAN